MCVCTGVTVRAFAKICKGTENEEGDDDVCFMKNVTLLELLSLSRIANINLQRSVNFTKTPPYVTLKSEKKNILH